MEEQNLTLIGKTHVLNTFALAQVLFITNVVHTPPELIREANIMFYRYLWGGPDKVQRAVKMKDYREEGLKVPELETKIKTHNNNVDKASMK